MKDILLSRKCPTDECLGVLWLDPGEPQTRDNPGTWPIVYCPECGYEEEPGQAEFEMLYGTEDDPR